MPDDDYGWNRSVCYWLAVAVLSTILLLRLLWAIV